MAEDWRSLYPFASHWHELDGVRLHYLDEGPNASDPSGGTATRAAGGVAAAERPALVMLHGNPTWSFFYRDLVTRFRDRYRCLVPDHIGMGLSDKPRDYAYTLQTHIDNLERWLDTVLPAPVKVTLIVHDWGGAIGMGWATRHPERIDRLVVMNTAAWPSTRIPWRIALCRWPVFGALAVRGFNAFARAATVMTTTRPLPPAVKAGFVAPYDSWAHRVATHEFVRDIPLHRGVRSHATMEAVAAALPSLREKPMLLAWGMRDWCFSPAFLDDWRTLFPAAEVAAFDQAGHYLLEDEGAAVAARIEVFLASGEGSKKGPS